MSHKGDYAKCRFCPKCGLERIEFDRYRADSNYCKAEFVCNSCGFGFRLSESARVQAAAQLFAQERKVRTGKFEHGVTPEAAEAWLKHTEKAHESWLQRLIRRGTATRFFDERRKQSERRPL